LTVTLIGAPAPVPVVALGAEIGTEGAAANPVGRDVLETVLPVTVDPIEGLLIVSTLGSIGIAL
jgi:hypothetical protein